MFRTPVVVLLTLLAPALLFGDTAQAQQNLAPADLPCSGYQRIRAELSERYAEEPVSLGLQSNGHLLQVFASAEGNTWTIVSLAPDGMACVVAAGASWEELMPAAGGTASSGDGI